MDEVDSTHTTPEIKINNQGPSSPHASEKPISSDSKDILALYDSLNKEDDYKNPSSQNDPDPQDVKEIENLIFLDLGLAKIEEKDEGTPQPPPLPPPSDQEAKTMSPPEPAEIQSKHNLDINDSLNRAESDQSIASTLTNSSQITTNKLKQDEHKEAPEEQLPEWIKEGAHVIVSTNSVMNKPGHVRYIGPTNFAGGAWIGVELEHTFGKNDGSVKGKRYFKCDENKGVFVRADKLTLVGKSI